jgi:hypothetical protein
VTTESAPRTVTPRPIELLRVSGGHRDAGHVIGTHCADAIARRCNVLDGATLAAAEPYRDVTAAELPWLMEELDAVADAAGVDRLALFAASVEELDTGEAGAPEPLRGCSDLVARGPATPDGHILRPHERPLRRQRG